MTRGGHSSSGFTLIEALVVLAVVGLAAGIAYPQLDRALGAVRARQARSDVSAALLTTRALALRTGAAADLKIDPDGNGFSIGGGAPHQLAGNAKIEGKPAQIWFYPDGTSLGGSLTLTTSVGRTTYLIGRDLGDLSATTQGEPGTPARLAGGNA